MKLSQDYKRVLASVPVMMYHGTDRYNLPVILSQGLIPNPKKRSWQEDEHSGFTTPSRASLPGIYLTTNLGTATASGSMKGNYGKCLVVVLVQSGSLLADEDDVKYRLNESIPSHEYTVMQLYTSSQALKNGLISDAGDILHLSDFVEEAQTRFVENVVSSASYQLKGGLTPHEKEQLIPILKQGFYVALARRAAYIGKYSWGYSEKNRDIPPPDKGQAEQDFKGLEDRLTRVLKRLGRPEHLERKFAPTARIETPVTYSGKNKIITVVEILPYVSSRESEDGKGGTPVIVRYPSSGEVPDKLIEDYTQSQGDWYEAVDRGQKAIKNLL